MPDRKTKRDENGRLRKRETHRNASRRVRREGQGGQRRKAPRRWASQWGWTLKEVQRGSESAYRREETREPRGTYKRKRKRIRPGPSGREKREGMLFGLFSDIHASSVQFPLDSRLSRTLGLWSLFVRSKKKKKRKGKKRKKKK